MENKNTRTFGVILLLIVVIVIAGVIIRSTWKMKQVSTVSQNNQPQVLVGTTTAGGQITIDNLAQNQTAHLPLTVTGVVSGWFFEGSFPVFIKDSNGNQIGVGLASSSQDWMTSNPIPFSVTLPAVNYTGPGTLVFTKDNPSGESQFDDSYTVNIVFQ